MSVGVQWAVWGWAQRAVSLLLVLPALALVLPVGVLIRSRAPGPIFIRLPREGMGGTCFFMFKLRTMVIDADATLERLLTQSASLRSEWERYGRLAADPRIAGRVAQIARRFSLDELPQIFNVACGQMALIGPRPLPVGVAASMAPADRKLRQTVLPGITGLWQVSGRSELSIAAMGALDRKYIQDRSLGLEMAILIRTPRAVFGGKGAY